MAIQKISSVRAAAYLNAISNNKADFEDSKKFFKEVMKQELQKGGHRCEIYEEAIKGFLLQIEPSDQQLERKIIARCRDCVGECNRTIQSLLQRAKWALIPWTIGGLLAGASLGMVLLM